MPNSDKVTVQRVVSLVPAGAGPYTFKAAFAPGVYRGQLVVRSNLTGTTTTIQVAPYVNEAMSVAAPSMFLAPNDAASTSATPALAAGSAGKVLRLIPCPGATGTPILDPILLINNGLLITVSKGTAVSGEVLEIDLVLSAIADAIAPNVVIT